MSGIEPFVGPAAGGLVKIVMDTVKAVGGDLFKAIGDRRKAGEALKKYADKYQSRYGLIKLLGMRQAVQLEGIYTNVRFLDDLSIRYFESIKAMEQAYRESGERRYQTGRKTDSRDGMTVANEHQYLMLLGGPGAGKSTFLRRLGLEALKGKNGKFQHQCLPVILELKQFTSGVDLLQAIAQEFQHFGFPTSKEFTIKALEQGNLLVLLDGLDEVPKEQFNAVIDAVQTFAVHYDKNRFVASCRIAAYRSGFQHFTDIELADFGNEQIRQFICNWFSSELDKQSGTAERCWQLLNQPANRAAKELAQTPLLLTFLCLVYDRIQRLPTNRSKLYNKVLDILLEEWAAEKRVQQDEIYQGLNIDLEKVLLAEIAYEGFSEDQLFFQRRQLVSSIKTFLSDSVDKPKYLDGAAVLDAIAVQQGILVERAEDVFSFSHLTLQEYLTALYVSQDYRHFQPFIKKHLTEKRWREVFLLVAGLLPKTDEMLEQMKGAAQQLINFPKLKDLLNWANQITTDLAGDHSLTSKRVVAIHFALDLALNLEPDRVLALALTRARDLPPALDLTRDFDRNRALTQNLDLTLAQNVNFYPAPPHTLDRDLALARSRTRARALDSALDSALDLKPVQIFKDSILSILVERLETLKTQIPEGEQPSKVWQSFDNRVEQTWLDAFQLKREWLELCDEETNALTNYLYACELIVRCKESAVRVSRQTWEKVEGRMLVPAQHTAH